MTKISGIGQTPTAAPTADAPADKPQKLDGFDGGKETFVAAITPRHPHNAVHELHFAGMILRFNADANELEIVESAEGFHGRTFIGKDTPEAILALLRQAGLIETKPSPLYKGPLGPQGVSVKGHVITRELIERLLEEKAK